MSKKYQPLIIDSESPFKEHVENKIKTTMDSDNGLILNEEWSFTRKRQYIRGSWVRLTQDKEILSDLSPHGCKILIHIALHLSMNQEKIKISRREVGMDWRMFSKVMMELLAKRIIANAGKREWYWVNVGLIIVGTINKHE